MTTNSRRRWTQQHSGKSNKEGNGSGIKPVHYAVSCSTLGTQTKHDVTEYTNNFEASGGSRAVLWLVIAPVAVMPNLKQCTRCLRFQDRSRSSGTRVKLISIGNLRTFESGADPIVFEMLKYPNTKIENIFNLYFLSCFDKIWRWLIVRYEWIYDGCSFF